MPKSSHSIEIQRSPEQVFAYLDDVSKLKLWLTSLEEVVPLTPGGNHVGAKTKHVYNEGGRKVEMLEETLVYEPNRRVKIKGETAGFWLTADYRLTPVPAGTQLDFEVELHMGSLLMKLLSPIVNMSSGKKMNEDLSRLKALVESEKVISR